MNNKGQNMMFAIITALMIFFAGMLFLNHLMTDVSAARTVGIECTDTSISDGAKLTCVGMDLVIPIVMIAIVSTAVGAIIARFVL